MSAKEDESLGSGWDVFNDLTDHMYSPENVGLNDEFDLLPAIKKIELAAYSAQNMGLPIHFREGVPVIEVNGVLTPWNPSKNDRDALMLLAAMNQKKVFVVGDFFDLASGTSEGLRNFIFQEAVWNGAFLQKNIKVMI